jgi:hypothetical protein
MTRNIRSGFCLSLFLIAGCGSDTPTSPTADFIALNSIAPAAGTALAAGDRVTFTAQVSCTIVTSDAGVCGMVIQDQGNRSLLAPGEIQPQADIANGTTNLTFSHTITIPEAGSTVTVALPIFVKGSAQTRAVVTRSYTVR